MIVHLIDGTYELFRCFYGNKHSNRPDDGWGAVRLVVQTMIAMVEEGATHLGVATDHVIESFRNSLWPGYKTGAGVDPSLRSQFTPLEEALEAFGFVVWPMVELEADDALASAAAAAAIVPEVEKVCIWTPDKDLSQCVSADRIVQVDRRGGHIRDEEGVKLKFGVLPKSIPDYLALVGDSADGYPGIPGWGAKSAASALSRFEHLLNIPLGSGHPESGAAGVSDRLAQNLRSNWEDALLFLELATLRTDAALFETVEALRWKGPRAEAAAFASKMGAESLFARAEHAAESMPPVY